jgi:hypothetical protein
MPAGTETPSPGMMSSPGGPRWTPEREVTVEPSNQIAEEAVRLAEGGDRETAVNELVRLADGDIQQLESARDVLVHRLRRRTDDYAATKGLTAINGAIARIGWPDPLEWKPRKWRIRR